METVNELKQLIENGEERKQLLAQQISDLNDEANSLSEAQQEDFNKAILNGKEPNEELASRLENVQRDIIIKQGHLQQIDGVIEKELKTKKHEVDIERRNFVNEKDEIFRNHFDKMNELKLAYLETLVDYSKMKRKYESEYSKTFREMEEKVGLRNRDTYYDFHLGLNQTGQLDDERYNPMIYRDEIKEAWHGKIHPLTERNRNKFK
ncbi:hypothetical protein [Terribacillus sp. DMT04]|uniref:hypothetical protein n=1 Tax=Terribacillus sp. DMT04 TaxID=2850441 RepID=UPI001C2CAA88|nr:hypothetical protein [Terribacillus sp. DMT04]QXE01735.1 hypothetical protein KS242_00140 [Terribacillus sp. DMT04]